MLNFYISSVLRKFRLTTKELQTVAWSWAYYFCILSAYYILRPIRDEMGIAGGTANLPWLFSATLIAILLANLPFSYLSRKLPRLPLITYTYRFFSFNLLVFLFLFLSGSWQTERVAQIFFVWTSVFNLFVVSIFWILMVDIFTEQEGKKMFGLIAAGGTIGAITGSALTALLSTKINPIYLLAVSAVLLEVAVRCVRKLSALSRFLNTRQFQEASRPIGGTTIESLWHIARSPYLLSIVGYILFYTVTSSSLYFLQADILGAGIPESGRRTALLATVDLLVNILTLLSQLFLTAPLLQRFGVVAAISFLPAITAGGFVLLAFFPSVGAIMAVQTIRRAGNFAITRPSRELLFTILPRKEKYRAKNFIDTVVYRAGDQVGAWSYAAAAAMGLGLFGLALASLPLAFAWLGNGIWIGRKLREEENKSRPNQL